MMQAWRVGIGRKSGHLGFGSPGRLFETTGFAVTFLKRKAVESACAVSKTQALLRESQ